VANKQTATLHLYVAHSTASKQGSYSLLAFAQVLVEG
jgi:hypothetical protein